MIEFTEMLMLFSGRVPGLEQLWIIGDIFCRETIHNLSMMTEDESYSKQNFDILTLSTERFSTRNTSPLARIINAFISGMERKQILPKIVVIVPEDDIINYLNHNDYGVTELFGKMIDYLDTELQKAAVNFKRSLPRRAKRAGCPQFVWICPSVHHNYLNNNLRRKFAAEMDVQLRGRPFTLVFKLKQLWNTSDGRLVEEDNNRLSKLGAKTLWQAIDRSICFANRLIFNPTCFKASTNCRNNRYYRRPTAAVPAYRRKLPAPPKPN